MIKAVVFDIGHTLVHYNNPLNWKSLYKPALQKVAQQCNWQLTDKNYEDAIDILCEYNTRINPRETEVSSDHIWNRIFAAWNKETSGLSMCKDAFYSFFRNEHFTYADVLEFLSFLRVRKIKTATLSDVPYGMENKYALEDIADIIEYIDLPYTSNDIGYRKPNIKGLQRIAEELGIAVREIMYIGDEEKDIICANNAGAVSVLIDRESKGYEYGQQYRVENLNELKGMVIKMDNKAFDSQRIAEGYVRRPWLHKEVMEQIKSDCNPGHLENGLDVGCGAGLSTKALRILCEHVTGTDISPEMIAVCEHLYKDSSYTFYVSKAEENKIPMIPYDIITAAGVINWVDKDLFLDNAGKILKDNGLIVIYDFWITDRMENKPEYTEWYQEKYLKKFPKPYRKESVWKQNDLTDVFRMEKQVTYDLTYIFSLDEFIDFMMIQSNVNAKIECGIMSEEEVRSWMENSLQPIFDGIKRTLVFEGYNWYIRKK